MKKIIQNSALLIPILFAAVCLAWFCRVYCAEQNKVDSSEYAGQQNKIELVQCRVSFVQQ